MSQDSAKGTMPALTLGKDASSISNPTATREHAMSDGQAQYSANTSAGLEHHQAAFVQNRAAMAEDNANFVDLEHRIRGMIVGNATQSQPLEPTTRLPPHMRSAPPLAQQQYLAQMDKPEKKATDASKPASGSASASPAPRKKLNQKQRREMKNELDIPLPATPPPDQGRNLNRQQPQHSLPPRPAAQNQALVTTQSQQWRRPPNPSQQQGSQDLRGTQPARAPPMSSHTQTQNHQFHQGPARRNVPESLPFQNQISNYAGRQPPVQPHYQHPGFHHAPPPQSVGHYPGSSFRPPPQNRQLYQPQSEGGGYRGPPQLSQPSMEEINAQSRFLEATAKIEVQNSEMSAEERQMKETFRALLESVCQDTIGLHEATECPVNSRVSLKCFGSLSSGFATKASDMDLALLSPLSIPQVSNFDSPIPRLLEKAFLNLGYGARLLTRTRVPIIKICEKPTPVLLEGLKREREKWELHKDDPPEQPKKKKRKHKKKKKAKPVKKDTGTVGGPHRPEPLGHVTKTNDTISPSIAKTRLEDGHEEAGTPSTVVDGNEEPRTVDEETVEIEDEEESDSSSAGSDVETEASPDRQAESTDNDIRVNSNQPLDKQTNLDSQTNSKQSNLDKTPEKPPNPTNPDPRPPRDTSLEFPKTGIGIQCDLNFSNHLALHNTLLLRCYSHADPRVRPMVIFVKAWAKTRTINSPYHGTLSSYGYVLMVLHYLVNIATPAVVPNLQLLWHHSAAPRGEGDEATSDLVKGYDIRFWRDEGQITALAASGNLTTNTSSLGSLLRGFFHYYAHQGVTTPAGGFNWSQSVLSLRTPGGLLTKKEKGWTGAKTTVDGKEVEKPVAKEKKDVKDGKNEAEGKAGKDENIVDDRKDRKDRKIGETRENAKDTEDTEATKDATDPQTPNDQKDSNDPKSAGKEVRHRYLVAIEDPFEIEHNVARTVGHFGVCAIRDEFRRAVRIIQRVGRGERVTEGLFDAGPDREKLEREARDKERKMREERERLVRERGEREGAERERVEKEGAEKGKLGAESLQVKD